MTTINRTPLEKRLKQAAPARPENSPVRAVCHLSFSEYYNAVAAATGFTRIGRLWSTTRALMPCECKTVRDAMTFVGECSQQDVCGAGDSETPVDPETEEKGDRVLTNVIVGPLALFSLMQLREKARTASQNS